MRTLNCLTTLFAAACLIFTLTAITGCDNKEKIIDIETPDGEVEVERDRDTGEVDIEVDDKE